MTGFEWLSDDRLVQRTEFGDIIEIFANFGTDPFKHKGVIIPGAKCGSKMDRILVKLRCFLCLLKEGNSCLLKEGNWKLKFGQSFVE